MKYFILLILTIGWGTQMTQAQPTESGSELFVVLTSEDAETQMMALVLATQTLNREVPVRILLCGEAGNLAFKDSEFPAFQPAKKSPKQLLVGLIKRGVKTEVCGIFLPKRNNSESDLLEGIGVARPPEVAEYMAQENVRYFTF